MLDWTLIEGKKEGDTINVLYLRKPTPTSEAVVINTTVTIDKKTKRNWILSNGDRFPRKTLLKFITNYNNQ